MWKIAIKVISGIYTKYLSGWRIMVLLGLVFGSYIMALKTETWNAERKLARQIKKSSEIQQKLDKRDIELETCQDTNLIANTELDNAINIANQCTRQWKQSKDSNAQAINDLNKQEETHAKEIERIKNIKPISDCDNHFLNDSDSKWLRGKKTNS